GRDIEKYIATNFEGCAHVFAYDGEQILVQIRCFHELHRRVLQAFLVNRSSVRTLSKPSDVDLMTAATEQRDYASILKNRSCHRQIMEVTGSKPRIVGDVLVSFRHLLDGKSRQQMLHRLSHGVDMAGG